MAIPLGGSNKLLSLNLWEWPGCLTAFALGALGFRLGWLDALPDRMWGGWGWPAAVFVSLESVLVVFGSVWLLAVAQRHLDRGFRWAGPRVSRSAYGAFMVQVVPLIGLAFALRPVPLPAEVKALVLAVASVVASFALAWLLISRVPGLRRVL